MVSAADESALSGSQAAVLPLTTYPLDQFVQSVSPTSDSRNDEHSRVGWSAGVAIIWRSNIRVEPVPVEDYRGMLASVVGAV